ncbi:MAG: guanylate kinase [Gammaproteobacteria bacterium]|nr:guanylate kinase [Gammaproteobacteria bacterium]
MSGSLIVISAPSGAGKSSLVKALIESTPNVEVAVSHTTRKPRPGEQDGVHYHFVDKERFAQMVAEDAFVEHAQVFDNFYGTAKSSLDGPLSQGRDLILEIDWQGARQICQLFPDCVSLFIAPPGLEALRQRLTARGQDDAEVIERRMRDARAELSHVHEFDYLVINDDFNDALTEIRSLVRALRLRRQLQVQRHADLMNNLLRA